MIESSAVLGVQGPRFAFAALYLRAQRDSGKACVKDDTQLSHDPAMTFTLKNLAEQLGVTHRLLLKTASRGWIGEELADRYACALGYHPVDVWPDWYEVHDAWAQRQVDVEAEKVADRAVMRRVRATTAWREGRCATAS